MNPYKVLGLNEGASEEDIKERYKEIVASYKEDDQDQYNQGNFRDINIAYDVLINGNLYKEVRYLIENNNFLEAEAKLNVVDDRKSAEWNYLQGFIAVQKGWFDTALSYLKTATEIEPNNIEYLESLNKLQSKVMEFASNYARRNSNNKNNMNNNNNMNACGGGGGGNGGMC
ncbi:DnaJ domain-containing protein [Clostridium taeniosporum]|uniref:Molecular chaperone DnaJ n=1 Tax=Clostridium taeniosporum TaxID=394958 RepID=A0A1D7XKJ5_9CLOT|nr:DnaJ domain-containing protein [Clostridium taeniosporum]AOR23854.1 molecular chaperone DnaJ [Clostridium taeniosporum]